MTPEQIEAEIAADRLACVPVVVPPAFAVGDEVLFNQRAYTIARVYPNSGVPMWHGTRRLLHTHCYELRRHGAPMWGIVDAELTPAPADAMDAAAYWAEYRKEQA